jgi:hypothetical protein
LYGYFDESAEAVVQDLRRTDAAGNVGDIARMRAMVRCDLKKVHRRDDSFDMPRWLATEMGISSWKAARWLAAGYALDELPACTTAYERGDLSTDQFVELARLATRQTDEELLPWAMRTSPAAIRARADRERRAEDEDIKAADKWRSLTWEWDENNTNLSFWGSLPADHGAKLITAVERLANKMAVTPEDEGDPTDPATTQDARRADALVAMASAAIADDQVPDKATVVVHTDIDGLLDGDRNGILHGGLPLPPNAASMLACDSRVQTVVYGNEGDIFHIGSPSYVVPRWLRRQVEHRDEYRCTFPNCGRQGFTQVHHIVPWPKRPTELTNLTLLCHAHHRLVHIHGWHVILRQDGSTAWFRPDWSPYQPRPAPQGSAPIQALPERDNPLDCSPSEMYARGVTRADHQLESEESGS